MAGASSPPISSGPAARLAGALAASLALHALAAGGLDKVLAPPQATPGGGLAPSLTILAHVGPALAQSSAQLGTPPRDERGVPLLPPSRYLDAAGLDTRPQIMTHVMPEFPPDLVSGARGRVVLELLIGPDGRLDAVNVAAAKPPGVFDESALRAFRAARFTPGMLKGRPVPSRLLIEVTFGD